MIVSLLTDTAPAVSQTINRIVEKTIERVVTGTTTPTYIAPVIVPPITDSEKTISSIQTNIQKIVIIREKGKAGESATSTAKIAIGAFVSSDGLIATDSWLLGDKTEFIISFGDQFRFAKKVYSNTALHMAFLQTDGLVSGDKSTDVIKYPALNYSTGEFGLGLPIIILGGENAKSISKGVLTEVPDLKTSPILTTDAVISSAYRGGIMFGLDGKVLGIVLSSADNTAQIIHYSKIASSLQEYRTPKSEPVKP